MKTKKKSKKKGFTLIELLVVIAIIAILSVVVVLTLNPAEMLRRSRDSNRASDLSMIKTAISLYLADVSSTTHGDGGYLLYRFVAAAVTQALWEFAASSTGTPEARANCLQWLCFLPDRRALQSNRGVNRTGTMAGVDGFLSTSRLVSSGAPIGQWPARSVILLQESSVANPRALLFLRPRCYEQRVQACGEDGEHIVLQRRSRATSNRPMAA